MNKRHQDELSAVAIRIFNFAEEEIQKYINKKYKNSNGDTMAQQMNDFYVISDEVTAYLVGNVMGIMNESCWDDNLKELNQHIRQIARYVASDQRAELGPKS